VKRRGGDRSSLTLEQRRQRFWERERRDAEAYSRLTDRQRRNQTKWLQRQLQWENAAKVGLIMLAAGEELPERLARAMPAPPVTGSPIGSLGLCLADVPNPAAAGTSWGSPWGSPWRRPA
jgi:hypothetical protein